MQISIENSSKQSKKTRTIEPGIRIPVILESKKKKNKKKMGYVLIPDKLEQYIFLHCKERKEVKVINFLVFFSDFN